MKDNSTNELPHYKYKKEIAQDLGISLSTLKRWLQNKSIKIPRGYVSPENQKIIYAKFCLDNFETTKQPPMQMNPNEPK